MGRTLGTLLIDSAARFGDRVAVVDRDRRMTYAELNDVAGRLASVLRDRGVGRGDRVGIWLDKSLESIVAIHAVLRAGAGYVPLDPSAPVARLGYIAGNCGIEVLLTGVEKAEAWEALMVNGAPLRAVIVMNGEAPLTEVATAAVLGRPAFDAAAPPAGAPAAGEDDLAYILYTSGSTGDPKGVTLSHRNALAFVDWAVDRFAVGPADVLSSHAPLHFDLSVFDLFAAAAAGASVVLVSPETSVFPIEVARFIERNAITIWYSVPSILSMMTVRGSVTPNAFPSLRTLLFAGEVFPTKYLRRLMELLPHATFFNLYGPTETNVCTYYEVAPIPPDRSEPIPIGVAIDGDEVFAMTDDGRIAGPGEVGELCVGGATVMQGYWGDEERTARSLVPDPRGGTGAVYRTGDLCRLGDDGNWILLGRRDAQIKSRGYRIELGDIEAALYAEPAVAECAVVAVPDELVTNRIKAYVVLRRPMTERDLALSCARRVPRYMVPDLFEFRDVLPKTSTGKIDRRALADAASAPADARSTV